MSDIQWRQFKEYSGPIIQGTAPIPPPTTRREFHVERAYWLTTKVETGATFGAVVAHDGTGMTVGPDQHIAVYPKELAVEDYNSAGDQGSLWKLLRRLEAGGEAPADYYHCIGELWEFFRQSMGAYVAQDGVLRYLDSGWYRFPKASLKYPGPDDHKYKAGDPVWGHHIRSSLTPTDGYDPGLGRVPKSGKEWETAARAAELFHALMAHPNGRQIQIEFGKEHLVKRSKRNGTVMGYGYDWREITSLRVRFDWSEEMDLALCVYQSHSVNAPAVANRALEQVGKALPHGRMFAVELIKELGGSTYGRWDDDLPTGRYQRTRQAAMASGLWSEKLFEGEQEIMPKDLVAL